MVKSLKSTTAPAMPLAPPIKVAPEMLVPKVAEIPKLKSEIRNDTIHVPKFIILDPRITRHHDHGQRYGPGPNIGVTSSATGYNITNMTDETRYDFIGLCQIGIRYGSRGGRMSSAFLEFVSLSDLPATGEGLLADVISAFPIRDSNLACSGGYPLTVSPAADLPVEIYLLMSETTTSSSEVDPENDPVAAPINSGGQPLTAFRMIFHFVSDDATVVSSLVWKSMAAGGSGLPPRIEVPLSWYKNGGYVDAFISPIKLDKIEVAFDSLVAVANTGTVLSFYSQDAPPHDTFSGAHVDWGGENHDEPIAIPLISMALNFMAVPSSISTGYEGKYFTLNCFSTAKSQFTVSPGGNTISSAYLYLDVDETVPTLNTTIPIPIPLSDASQWTATKLCDNASINDQNIITIPDNVGFHLKSVSGVLSRLYITTDNISLLKGQNSEIRVIKISLRVFLPVL
jgi:hypothetical protein